MTKGNQFKRALALSTALSVVALGATTTAAEAALDPGKSQGKSQSTDKHQGKGQAKGHEKKSAPSKGSSEKGGSEKGGSPSSHGNGKAKGHANGGGQSTGQGSSQAGSSASQDSTGSKGKGGDPAGNNGTVKITPHGEVDGIPQNTPHVGCVFDVEWYGFDEGDDIISQVTFESWAPTAVPMTVNGPSQVFVGDDPASGAGVGSDEDGTDADNGFDGEAAYTLSFDGEPHPQQGYHVKLTISTPGSQGADVKHKVFWVQECEVPETPETPPTTPETPEVEGEEGNDLEHEIEILGEQANGQQGSEVVPNAVNAGLGEADVISPVSTLPMMLTLYGAVLAGLALLIRRRRTS